MRTLGGRSPIWEAARVYVADDLRGSPPSAAGGQPQVAVNRSILAQELKSTARFGQLVEASGRPETLPTVAIYANMRSVIASGRSDQVAG